MNILNLLKSEYTYALLGSYPESSIEVQLIEAPDAVLQVNLYNAAFSGTVPPIRNNFSKQEIYSYLLPIFFLTGVSDHSIHDLTNQASNKYDYVITIHPVLVVPFMLMLVTEVNRIRMDIRDSFGEFFQRLHGESYSGDNIQVNIDVSNNEITINLYK